MKFPSNSVFKILFFLIIFIFVETIFTQENKVKITSVIPWGINKGEIGSSSVPELQHLGTFPTAFLSFYVYDDKIYLLDTMNNRVNIYKQDKIDKTVSVSNCIKEYNKNVKGAKELSLEDIYVSNGNIYVAMYGILLKISEASSQCNILNYRDKGLGWAQAKRVYEYKKYFIIYTNVDERYICISKKKYQITKCPDSVKKFHAIIIDDDTADINNGFFLIMASDIKVLVKNLVDNKVLAIFNLDESIFENQEFGYENYFRYANNKLYFFKSDKKGVTFFSQEPEKLSLKKKKKP